MLRIRALTTPLALLLVVGCFEDVENGTSANSNTATTTTTATATTSSSSSSSSSSSGATSVASTTTAATTSTTNMSAGGTSTDGSGTTGNTTGVVCNGNEEILLVDAYDELCITGTLEWCDPNTCGELTCNVDTQNGSIRQQDPYSVEGTSENYVVEMTPRQADGMQLAHHIPVNLAETCAPRFVATIGCGNGTACNVDAFVAVDRADWSENLLFLSWSQSNDGLTEVVDVDLSPFMTEGDIIVTYGANNGTMADGDERIAFVWPRLIDTR